MPLTREQRAKAEETGRLKANEAFGADPPQTPPTKQPNFWPTVGGQIAGSGVSAAEKKEAAEIAQEAYENEWAKLWKKLNPLS